MQLEIIRKMTASSGCPGFPTGAASGQCLGLDDVVLDIRLTANQGDLLSIRGLAAELSAVLEQTLCPARTPAVQGKNPAFLCA